MVVAGDARHDGSLVRHGGTVEVYKQVSQSAHGRVMRGREVGGTQRKLQQVITELKNTTEKKLVLQFKSGELLKIKGVYILR